MKHFSCQEFKGVLEQVDGESSAKDFLELIFSLFPDNWPISGHADDISLFTQGEPPLCLDVQSDIWKLTQKIHQATEVTGLQLYKSHQKTRTKNVFIHLLIFSHFPSLSPNSSSPNFLKIYTNHF